MAKEKTSETPVKKNLPPTHSVFLVKNDNGKACFEQVGTLKAHPGGKGFNQTLSFHDWDISLFIRENS